MFGGAASNRTGTGTGTGQPNPDGVFADVFDEVFLLQLFVSIHPVLCLNYISRSYCAQKLSDTSLGGPGLGLYVEQA